MAIELDVDSGNQESNKPNIPQKREFLSEIPIHNISKVFSNFAKENRTLIVPIGFPQAGKSLLLSSLMYYARKGKETSFKVNLENDFPYDKGRHAVDDMVKYFDEGKLYDATQKGTLDLIGVNIKPSNEKFPLLKLGFLDLAGEDIKTIKTSEGAEFTNKINAVFNGLKIDNSPIIFVLITPYEPAQLYNESIYDAHNREDTLHYDFFNYMKQNQSQLLKNCKFFIVVSQWDKNPEKKQTVEDFIKENRPSMYNYVKDSNVIWGEYSIGQLLVTNENGVNIQEIVRINHFYPSNFWKKLYQICTNKNMSPTIPWYKKIF